MMTEKVVIPHFPSLPAAETPPYCYDLDDRAFHSGYACHAWACLGAHTEGEQVLFRLWAPRAVGVSVLGIEGDWTVGIPMVPTNSNDTHKAIWQAALPARRVPDGTIYKYRILFRDGHTALVADPYGRAMEPPPATATVFERDIPYDFRDSGWMEQRAARMAQGHPHPLNIYEVHPSSWLRHRDGSLYSYHALADELAPYMKQMGFTHVLLSDLTDTYADSPLTGHFAPSARYGSRQELRELVSILHGAGIGVLLDWAPPAIDAEQGEEISYLLSNAYYWIEAFHIDGLRVISAENNGESIPLWQAATRRLLVDHPDILIIAPASGVSNDRAYTHFENLPWVQDTLDFAKEDPLFRRHHHKRLVSHGETTDGSSCLLSLSLRAVGHPHRSFLDHMPGDYWQKFAGARVFAAWAMTHPGAKLWCNGCEIGQFSSRDEEKAMEWYLLDFDSHARLQHYFAALNRLYATLPALWDVRATSVPPAPFAWLEADKTEESILAYRRTAPDGQDVVVVLNFTPVARESFPIRVPALGSYREIFNSDELAYGGSGVTNPRALAAYLDETTQKPVLPLRIPPLGCTILTAVPSD